MSVDFYLFNVGQGQAAALRLPSNRWCLFDLGACSSFSPWAWVSQSLRTNIQDPPRLSDIFEPNLRPYWVTVSHLHGDHLADGDRLVSLAPLFINTVAFDEGYLRDAIESSSSESAEIIKRFVHWHVSSVCNGSHVPNFDGVKITEKGLSMCDARTIGGNVNSRVNNASIVTRIDYAGRSILLCGDMEQTGWEYALCQPDWRAHISNIDILVAPHHGHKSGYSQELIDLARPTLVLVSVTSYDTSVDPRYSSPSISGLWDGSTFRKSITTRQDGHISVRIQPTSGRVGEAVIQTSNGITGGLGPKGMDDMVSLMGMWACLSKREVR